MGRNTQVFMQSRETIPVYGGQISSAFIKENVLLIRRNFFSTLYFGFLDKSKVSLF
jgi:hypothetical protein